VNERFQIKDQLLALQKLQELDLKIDSLKRKKAALPANLKAAQDAFNKVKSASELKQGAIGEIEKARKQTQAAIELNKERLERAGKKLEAVHNTQEFQAASKEFEQLRKLGISFDEQMKKTALEIDTVGKDRARLDEQLVGLKAELDARQTECDGHAGVIDAEVAVLMNDRRSLVPMIDAPVVLRYDRVRAARCGIGFVQAVGGRCGGCNMMIPPQLYNEIQKAGEIHSCPNCNRMLFVPPAPPQPDTAAAAADGAVPSESQNGK